MPCETTDNDFKATYINTSHTISIIITGMYEGMP